MIRLEEKYDQALQFRKRGFTYSEIAKIVGVSKSTVSNWLAKKPFSKKVREENAQRAARENVKRMKLLNKARAKERSVRYAEAVRSAEIEFRHYKKNPLFVAGLMIYMSEGDNTHQRPIRLTSAQFDMHRIFLKFAKEYLGVPEDRIHFWILLYPNLNEIACMRFWMKGLKLKKEQWYKNHVIEGRNKKRILHNGVGNTIIGSTVLKAKLDRWIELALKEL